MMSVFAQGVCVLEDRMVRAVLGLVFVESWHRETMVVRRRIKSGMVDSLRGRLGCHDDATELELEFRLPTSLYGSVQLGLRSVSSRSARTRDPKS